MNKLLTTLCAVAIGATAGAVALPAPAHAASTVTIRPESLTRGAEVAGAHLASLASKTIIDGDVRVSVPGSYVDLLGEHAGKYVVLVERKGAWSTLRVGPGGSERVIARGTTPDDVVLASDGGLIAITRSQTSTRTKIDVLRVSNGTRYTQRAFSKAPRVLDILGDQAVVGGPDSGTISWDLGAGTVKKITGRFGYRADLGAGRLATFDGDPYDGGCTLVTSLARPTTRLWRSCQERVDAFSPDGKRVATVAKLTDGRGPNRVTTRSIHGSLLATYRVSGHFGLMRWESEKALLLATFGQDKAAIVRCTGSTCVRATVLSTSPDFRQVATGRGVSPRAWSPRVRP
ncbi:hypothetical protein [Nocardioides plantarum]|uniref:Uncharacterized protein n=1 Tax=Nocardioides plantarum TaxID=29299 RepID=A0ABV5KDU4_9ACTN|nr:hypothetical protein [Nocardioides plantarum]